MRAAGACAGQTSGHLYIIRQSRPAVEPQIGQGNRTAEEISLRQLATGRAQEGKLLDRLDALRGRLDIQIAPKASDGADDRGAIDAAGHALNEGLVDLDLIDREHLQIFQGRIADTKIVEDNGDAQALDLAQQRRNMLAAQQYRLG